MRVILPKTITSAMFVSSSVAEPDPLAGEVLWNAATSYLKDAFVVRATTHKVYRCLVPGVNAELPENSPTRWYEERASNRWAWADNMASTQTVGASPYTHVVRPGAINDVSILAVENVDLVRLRVWDSPGGTLVFDKSFDMVDAFSDDPYWSFFFELPMQRLKIDIRNIPSDHLCEVELTLTSYDGQPVRFGICGHGTSVETGLAQYGFKAKPTFFGRIEDDGYGNFKITPGRAAKDLSGTAEVPKAQANFVVRTFERLLGVPVIAIPSEDPDDDYLTAYGIVSVDAAPTEFGVSRLTFEMQGLT